MQLTHYIAHFFYPRHSNNHRAKVLHPQFLFLITGLLLLFQFALGNVGKTVGILGYAANISPTEVISLSNVKRAESGTHSLKYSQALTNAARAKGEHMLTYDYWAHVAPDGTEPWKFFQDNGYSYKFAGENLARDFSNPNDAVNAWMASPTHKDNLLSSKYTDIGVAVVEGDLAGVDTTIIVQLFGAPLSGGSEPVPVASAQEIVFTPTPLIPTATPVPTLIPTATPIPATPTNSPPTHTPTPTNVIPTTDPLLVASGESTSGGPTISPFNTTKNISIIVTIALIGIFVVDAAYIAYTKVPRTHGKTFAHLSFLGMVLVIAIFARAGSIL